MRWAGKGLTQIGTEVRIAFRFLLSEQVVIIVPLSLLLYFILQPPFQWVGLMALAYAFIFNLVAFFMFIAQATRRFNLLTAVNVSRGLVLLILIILVFALGYSNYHYVIFAFLSAFLFTFFAFAFRFRQYLGGEMKSKDGTQMPAISSLWTYGKENIKLAFFVLLGNIVLVLFWTIDRLMVSSFFPIEQFAIYAFALMVSMVAYSFVQAVSQVFFPYLSRIVPESRTRAYQLGKPTISLVWASILAVYFPITKLIEFYLPHYVASLPIMQILFCTVGFGSLIQILHVNYYKAYRKQRQYFLWGTAALALSVILNILAIKVWGTLESVAVVTLISFGAWYIANELSLKSVLGERNKELWRGLAILGSYLAVFWLASFLADWFIAQMLIYFGFFCVVTWLLLGSETRELVSVAKRLLNQHGQQDGTKMHRTRRD